MVAYFEKYIQLHIIKLICAAYFSGTNRFFRKIASRANLVTSLVDATDVENVKAAMKPNTKVADSNINILYGGSELLTWLSLCCKCQMSKVNLVYSI